MEEERAFRVICREMLVRGTTTKELSSHPKLKAEYRYYITLIRRELVKEGDDFQIEAIRLEPKILPSGQKVYNNYGYKIEPKQTGQSEMKLQEQGAN